MELQKNSLQCLAFFKDRETKVRSSEEIAKGFNNYFATIGSNLDKELKVGHKSYRDYITQSKCRFHFKKVTNADIQKILKSRGKTFPVDGPIK